MLNLYTISTKNTPKESKLNIREKFSVLYHNIFEYPLSSDDLIKWITSKKAVIGVKDSLNIKDKNGHYYLEGQEKLIYKQALRKKISSKKMNIAKKSAKLLSYIPGILMVGVTGSLAMENSASESDIDLMVITKKDSLWTTRLLSYLVLSTKYFALRRPFDRNQKDKLCLNMWLDERDLIWKTTDRNLYTAHEIAQVIPLVNKDKTYEKFLGCNRWILDFWPNAVKRMYMEYGISYIAKPKGKYSIFNILYSFIEKLAYFLQLNYMKNKITRETVTKTRALFHPQDWGKVVMRRLAS